MISLTFYIDIPINEICFPAPVFSYQGLYTKKVPVAIQTTETFHTQKSYIAMETFSF